MLCSPDTTRGQVPVDAQRRRAQKLPRRQAGRASRTGWCWGIVHRVSAAANAISGASRRVAEAADAWLTDPRDVEAYRRLVVAVDAWRALVRPVLPGTEHTGRRVVPDLPAARDSMDDQLVLDPGHAAGSVEQADIGQEQLPERAQPEQELPHPEDARPAGRVDQTHETSEVPLAAGPTTGPEELVDVPAPPPVGDLLRGADVREVLQRLRRG